MLELNGRRIGDSTAIIAALEEHKREPAAVSSQDPLNRARALELEDWFDENLAPPLRRFIWHHTLSDTDAVIAALFTRPSPMRARMLRATAPIARWAVRRDYDITGEKAAQARTEVLVAMARLEAELQPSGYLVDGGFTVADLTAAALFTPVLAARNVPTSRRR